MPILWSANTGPKTCMFPDPIWGEGSRWRRNHWTICKLYV